MKKKIYNIIYSVVQLLVSVYMMIFSKSVAIEQVEMLQESFKAFPAELQESMSQLFSVEQMVPSVLLTGFIGGILAIILLWIFIKGKVSTKKGLAVGLTIASIFLFGGAVSILAVVSLILIANTKVDDANKVVKEKKKVEKLAPFKLTVKDYIWSIILVVFYCTQFIVPNFIENKLLSVIYIIGFYIIVLILIFCTFRKRFKRDFSELKNNFSTYIGYIFKWWAIMLGLSLVTGIIRIVLGGDMTTANQTNLNDSPLWYVGPLAIIWAPLVEEGIFRGVLRRFVKYDKLFIILSALIFGLLHTVGTEVGIYNMLIQSLQYMAMGGVMAYVYTKSNNIFTNIGIHFIQNSIGVIMMILMSLV